MSLSSSDITVPSVGAPRKSRLPANDRCPHPNRIRLIPGDVRSSRLRDPPCLDRGDTWHGGSRRRDDRTSPGISRMRDPPCLDRGDTWHADLIFPWSLALFVSCSRPGLTCCWRISRHGSNLPCSPPSRAALASDPGTACSGSHSLASGLDGSRPLSSSSQTRSSAGTAPASERSGAGNRGHDDPAAREYPVSSASSSGG